ncbi:thermonuclease family protein [Aliiroseovarius sediminis]|uniref:thermonuclease family protein n=1 Tax=Aliiroseovarius sediminis TaxID=2925839 RepID=UPI0021072D61|nr:thermonuclease family protein [Aliiroseovarius sediminis]
MNAWLVREGWAVAYRRYSRDYIRDETEARSARRNIWSGRFDMPWDWRRAQRGG